VLDQSVIFRHLRVRRSFFVSWTLKNLMCNFFPFWIRILSRFRRGFSIRNHVYQCAILPGLQIAASARRVLPRRAVKVGRCCTRFESKTRHSRAEEEDKKRCSKCSRDRKGCAGPALHTCMIQRGSHRQQQRSGAGAAGEPSRQGAL
jgi:hypothetical protein